MIMEPTSNQKVADHRCQCCNCSLNSPNLPPPPPYRPSSKTDLIPPGATFREGYDTSGLQENFESVTTIPDEDQFYKVSRRIPTDSLLATAVQIARLPEKNCATKNDSKRAPASSIGDDGRIYKSLKKSITGVIQRLEGGRKRCERSTAGKVKQLKEFFRPSERQLRWHAYIESRTPDPRTANKVGFRLFCVRELPRWMYPSAYLGEHLYWYKGDDEAALIGENCQFHDTDKCYCVEFYEGVVAKKKIIFDLLTGAGFRKIREDSLLRECSKHKSMDCYCWLVFNEGKWWNLDLKSKTKKLNKRANESEAKQKMTFAIVGGK